MVELIAKNPLEDLLPVHAGDTSLSEATPAFITSLSPLQGKAKACGEGLKKAYDIGLPAAGRSTGKAGMRVIWTGRGQYFLVGGQQAGKALAKCASLTDQSDGWVVMQLTGASAVDVLARLTPIDLRADVFKRGHTARTELAHMMSIMTRTTKGFEIMVMRSFAKTAVYSVKAAMQSVAAEADLRP